MKKILLSFAVALVAMSASAQSTRLKNVNLNLSKFNVEQNFKTIETPAPLKAISISTSNSKAKIVKKADADNSDIFGLFIQTFAGEDVPEFTVCLTDTIYKADATVKVPIDTLGNTTDVKCNICLKRNFGGYRISEPYYGIYEEDDNGASIIFPEQISLKADGVSSTSGAEYHYDIYMYNINLTDDGTQIENIDLLSFEGDGDGVFYSSADGWGLFYTDRTTGKGLGWGGFVWDPVVYQANGKGSWYTSRDGQRTDYNSDVFIEDFETQVSVYGWMNAKLAMEIGDDLSVKMAAGFPIADLVIKEADGYTWDAGRILAYGWEIDEDNYIVTNDDPYIYGTLSGNTITIPGIYTRSEVGGSGDYQGYYYGINFYRQNTFTLNDGSFAAGISETTMTREDVIKNTKTYNLMGQQVNRSAAKGLLIRDGKKFMSK